MSAAELIETELERLAAAQIQAAEEAKKRLQLLVEEATTVIESLGIMADHYTISTSVMILDRNLSEALRETTKYDAWRHARRRLEGVKRQLEKAGDSP